MKATSNNGRGTKRTFWIAAAFYFLIAFEFFYMASPFAIYFYSVYRPGLKLLDNSTFSWLCSMFLPHIVVETSSLILNIRNIAGSILAIAGFLFFIIGAVQVYYNKIFKKGAVVGGIYRIIRHPQYLSLMICSFGLLILWPRYLVLLSFILMTFIYYLLAKVEEQECERKYGEKYAEYKKHTKMFLPFRIPFSNSLFVLPKNIFLKYIFILVCYMAVSILSVLTANVIKDISINSLIAVYNGNSAFVSVIKYERKSLEKIVNTVLADYNVRLRLKSDSTGTKYINYVLPSEMYVSEIPMNPTADLNADHFMPKEYNGSIGKIVFTKVKNNYKGKDLFAHSSKRIPVMEVFVDVKNNKVIKIIEPCRNNNYAGIPMPVF